MTKILKGPDDVVKVGEALAEIEPGGSDASAGPTPPPARATPTRRRRRAATPQAEYQGDGSGGDAGGRGGTTAEPVDLVMPEMGESVTEGTVLEWHETARRRGRRGRAAVEVSTDKVDAEVPSPVAGTLTETLVEPDDVVKVGQALARMQAGAGGAGRHGRRATAPPPRPPVRGQRRGADADAKASPVARRDRRGRGRRPVRRRRHRRRRR